MPRGDRRLAEPRPARVGGLWPAVDISEPESRDSGSGSRSLGQSQDRWARVTVSAPASTSPGQSLETLARSQDLYAGVCRLWAGVNVSKAKSRDSDSASRSLSQSQRPWAVVNVPRPKSVDSGSESTSLAQSQDPWAEVNIAEPKSTDSGSASTSAGQSRRTTACGDFFCGKAGQKERGCAGAAHPRKVRDGRIRRWDQPGSAWDWPAPGAAGSSGFALRGRPRKGCSPNSASFSDRMP
jgi:hypothetical protein